MNHTTRNLLVASLLAIALLSPVVRAQPSTRPTVWMMPPGHENGRALRELFEHPEQWAETRSLIDGVGYADHNLNRQFTDEQLRAWLPMLQQWKLKFELETGAVKPWGQTGEKAFNVERPMWQRYQHLGGRIYSIAMDEPLLCCRKDIKKSDDYAVQETAAFIALVRKNFPDILVGDIETFPSIPVADHRWWIETLNAKLKQLGVRGLDFYRVDVNWINFIVQNQGTWREVRELERYCRQHKLPFSLIYWASGLPGLKRKGLADDSTWYTAIMQQGYDYAMVDGAPDQYVVESWVSAPDRCLPETGEFTFTRSVRDFVRKFPAQRRHPATAPAAAPR